LRRARHKNPGSAFYHIVTRLAGYPGDFPLQKRRAALKLLEIIQDYIGAYCCQLVGYSIMGSHYHFIVFFEEIRPMSSNELKLRAQQLYGNRFELKTAHWSPFAWEKFNRKLFDVSSLMQHINGEYAKWFNRKSNRRGHLWADRFKNPELLDPRALQECLLYIELNAVRAKIVARPEHWQASSAWARCHHQDQDLMPLEEIFAETPSEEVFAAYRSRLYERAALAEANTHRQRDRVSPPPERFTNRLRFFTDGLAIGRQDAVGVLLEQWRSQGRYRYRKKPIPQLSGFLFTLREQRSHGGP